MADRVVRIALVVLAGTGLLIGAWASFSPRSFYDRFPGGGRTWVAADGPYNEHLIRDFGSAGLGLAVLAGLAAVWMERRLVQAAAIALFLGSLPHAIYHSTSTEAYSTSDNIFSLGGLYLQALLPLLILYLATGRRQAPGAARASTSATRRTSTTEA
jgi:hypothetical protein